MAIFGESLNTERSKKRTLKGEKGPYIRTKDIRRFLVIITLEVQDCLSMFSPENRTSASIPKSTVYIHVKKTYYARASRYAAKYRSSQKKPRLLPLHSNPIGNTRSQNNCPDPRAPFNSNQTRTAVTTPESTMNLPLPYLAHPRADPTKPGKSHHCAISTTLIRNNTARELNFQEGL